MIPPPIPDAPNKLPWWIGYAEHNGRMVVYFDYRRYVHADGCWHFVTKDFGVGISVDRPLLCACEHRAGLSFNTVLYTDSEAEALAEFHKQAARLAEEG